MSPLHPKVVVGLIRVSTREQSLGPQAQKAALERWCQQNDAKLVAVHQDIGVSGGAPLDRRPGLLSAIDEVKERKAQVLLVAKRDRLARDVVLAAMIERLVEKAGARVMAADGAPNEDGPEHALMRRIVDAFAEYERALIRARTKAGLAVKKSRGERIGGVPYGFRLDADGKKLVEDPGEQAVVEKIQKLRSEGLSLRGIVAQLNEERVPARGESWHLATVAKLAKI